MAIGTLVEDGQTRWTTAQVTVTVRFARPASAGEPSQVPDTVEPRLFDFSDFIANHTKDFTGREWVFAEIDSWLADPNGPSFFIITGEPGVGKSAIAARLTQVRDLAAYHFCIAAQADTLDPTMFARSLSYQLCQIAGFANTFLMKRAIQIRATRKIRTGYTSQTAQKLAQAGQLEQALAAAEAIQDDGARSQALSQVAQALAQAGQPERALAAAEAIQDDGARSEALGQVAQALGALVQSGQSERAAQALERALAAAEAIQNDEARSWALSQVAQALAQAGQPERAAQALERALAAAEAIQNDGAKTIALTQMGAAFVEDTVSDASSASEAFSDVVLEPFRMLFEQGYDRQIVLLVDGLDDAEQLEGPETIVDLLAKLGSLSRQVRILVTCRLDPRVLRRFEDAQRLDLIADSPSALDDIRVFVQRQLELSSALRDRVLAHMAEAAFVEQVTAASQGNFLYVSLLLQEIARGTQSFEVLPKGLEALLRGTPLEIETMPFEPKTILIPGGPFLIGSSDPSAPPAEQPQYELALSDFRIGRYPVTCRQYAAFLRDRKDQPVPQDWFNRQPPPDRLDHPVTGVSWHDAVAYCAWLSEQTGRRYVLPSEAEWEKAASWGGGGEGETRRQGSKDGKRRYPWGDEWAVGRCNVTGSGTTAVMAHPDGASAHGVEDLLGNVQEWTRSLWGSQPERPEYAYPYNPSDGREIFDPGKLPDQARLVHRGGSFKSSPADLRCSARGNALADSIVGWRGFRVALAM